MKYYIVDVFAENKYKGNPLCVFFCDKSLKQEEMQQIAFEIHFSEVIFIIDSSGKDYFDARIFTPDVELPFAGHPILGAAYAITQEYRLSSKIILRIKDKTVTTYIQNSRVTLYHDYYCPGPCFEKSYIARIISLSTECVDPFYPVQLISSGLPAIAIPLLNLEALEHCAVNHDLYSAHIKQYGKANLFPFLWNDECIRARCFMDDPGYLEDPATGSANIALAHYLVQYKYPHERQLNRYRVIQGKEMGRESIIDMEIRNRNNENLIGMTGNIIVLADGEWKF